MTSSFDMADIVEEVIELTGGPGATAANVSSVQRSIWLVLQDWASAGLNQWRTDSLVVVTDGTSSAYALPPDVDDVLEVRASTDPGTVDPGTGSWPAIRRVSRDEYNRISSRDIRGRPSRFHLVRDGDQPVMKLHPVGMVNGGLEVIYVRRPQPFSVLQADLSRIPERCMSALIAATAHKMAIKRRLPPAEIAELAAARADAEAKLRIDDRDRVPFRVLR